MDSDVSGLILAALRTLLQPACAVKEFLASADVTAAAAPGLPPPPPPLGASLTASSITVQSLPIWLLF